MSLALFALSLPIFLSCNEEPISKAKKTSQPAAVGAWETVLDNTSFASTAAFQSKWNYLYPWGADHNGSARMQSSKLALSGGVLTISATPTSGVGNSTQNPFLPIRYYSGACHAKSQVLINDQFPEWEVRVEAQVPTVRGTWPAFWLTGVNSWPPESDILEFKGSSVNWQNTFDGPDWTSVNTQTILTTVSSPGSWHSYRAWITKVNSTDVDIHYYVDGAWKGVHRAPNFVGKPMWLIINMQMEGSSGSPGPTSTRTYKTRNPYIGRTRAW